MSLKSLYKTSYDEIQNFFINNNYKKFRFDQFMDWIINKQIKDFNEISNLPKTIIDNLKKNFYLSIPTIYTIKKSDDFTTKYLIKLEKDNNTKNFIECVAMKNKNKITLCISSQVGCHMGCKFCATGYQGFRRNLFFLEIISQIILVKNSQNSNISNIVFMGQGEPFLNYKEVISSLNFINNKNYFNIGARKITISTCGIIPKIKRFSSVDKQYGLAVSLHSAIQKKRDEIMPGVKKFDLIKLKNEIINYIELTNRRVTIEYILIKNFNMDSEDIEALTKYCKDIHCNINLIKYNKNKFNNTFIAPTDDEIIKFKNKLLKNKLHATIRNSKGSEINAACGQLSNNYNNVSCETLFN